MVLLFMNKMALIEILVVGFAVVGIVMVIKEKRLSAVAKILWLFFVMMFNFIAVLCFILWKKWDKKEVNCSNS